MNLKGQKINQFNVTNRSSKHINLGNLNDGIYFLKLTDTTGSITKKIIIKNK